jgi:hypothetical protein
MERSDNAPNSRQQANGELAVSFFKDSDSSGYDDEDHWTYPHKFWANWLWKEMQQQGFYQPHIKVTYKSSRHRLYAGKTNVTVNIAIELELCVQPPTKLDFVNALLFISPPLGSGDSIDVPIHDDGPTHRWMQELANNVVKPCRHPHCETNGERAFRLVQKCFQPVPDVALNRKNP